MYEYEYTTVIGEGVFSTKFKEHREIIDRRAKEGWRFAGWVPFHISDGAIAQIDLVFEREVSQA